MTIFDNIIVTIATQRSGTKFFGSCLNDGGLVRSFGESWKTREAVPSLASFAASYIGTQVGFRFYPEEISAFLDAFLAHLLEVGRRPIAHLDIMYDNLGAFAPVVSYPGALGEDAFLLRYLRARRVVVVHLVRENIADSYASSMIAQERGRHHVTSDTPLDEGVLIEADLEKARRFLVGNLRAREAVRTVFAGSRRYVELRYPEFIEGDTIAISAADTVRRLLGLDEEGSPRLFGRSPFRQSSPNKAHAISNYAALQALFDCLANASAGGSAPAEASQSAPASIA